MTSIHPPAEAAKLCGAATASGQPCRLPTKPEFYRCALHMEPGERAEYDALYPQVPSGGGAEVQPKAKWELCRQAVIAALRERRVVYIDHRFWVARAGSACEELSEDEITEWITAELSELQGQKTLERHAATALREAQKRLVVKGAATLLKPAPHGDPLRVIGLPPDLHESECKPLDGVLWLDGLVRFEWKEPDQSDAAVIPKRINAGWSVWSRRQPVQAKWFDGEPDEPTPLWDDACSRWGWDAEMKAYVEAQVGWSILEQGQTDHGIVKLVGEGGAGKSTLLNIVAGIVGAAKKTALVNLGTRFGSQVLENARVLLIPEAAEADMYDHSTRHGLTTLKALAGDDDIPIEPKGKQQYHAFSNTCDPKRVPKLTKAVFFAAPTIPATMLSNVDLPDPPNTPCLLYTSPSPRDS